MLEHPTKTQAEFETIIDKCRLLFEQKTIDYGTSWRILRLPSFTDQLFIKAKRIRTIEENGQQRILDSIESEFVGIINYCVMALIQFHLSSDAPLELGTDETMRLYNHEVEKNKQLMFAKNHDYGEAWRDMRVSSFTDLILMKLLRIKQIEDNKGQTLVSENIEAGYRDILNYAVFASIQLNNIPS